jgi:hypothetical protein
MKLSLLTSVVALASSTFAASLQQVTNYGTNPTNVRHTNRIQRSIHD